MERVRDLVALAVPLLLVAAGVFTIGVAIGTGIAGGDRGGAQRVVTVTRAATPTEGVLGTTTQAATATAAAAASTSTAASATASPHGPRERSETRYVVRRGDTLWEIAAKRYDNPRTGMRLIKKRNKLKSLRIRYGQVLILPS